jgi:hypothetical protein
MILCIEIIISYIISYDMTALDIVIRYHGLGMALLGSFAFFLPFPLLF